MSKIKQFFLEVLGIVSVKSPPRALDMQIPEALIELYEQNAGLEESLLETDVRILTPDRLYQVNGYTVFAEENQSVVLWSYIDGDDYSDCFRLSDFDNSLSLVREERNVRDLVLGLLVINSLSSSIFPYYEYSDLKLKYLDNILARHPVSTEVSKLQVVIQGAVACTLQVSDTIFVSAASRNESDLKAFMKSLKEMSQVD